jgi:hypothetical protein
LEGVEQVNKGAKRGDHQRLAEGEGAHTTPTGRVKHDQPLHQQEAPDEGGVGAWTGREGGRVEEKEGGREGEREGGEDVPS